MFKTFIEYPFIVLISITGAITLYYLYNRHKEKIELIKKGENLIYQDALQKMKYSNLGRGIITLSIALGLMVGHILEIYTELNPVIIYTAALFLFFGIGSIVFFIIIKNK